MIHVLTKEIRDALGSRWLLGYAAVLGILGAAAAVTGLSSAAGLGLQGFGRTAATLTNLCLLLAPLIALAMGSLSIAGERDRGTLDHLLAQPLDRRELLLGKYLGLLAALGAATFAGFAPAGLAIAAGGGPSALLRLLPFPLLASLLIASMLAVGMLISVRSSGGVQALGLAIVLWFLFVLVYDLLLMGVLMTAGLGAGALALLLLLNPIDCARVLVVLTLEPDLYLLGPAGALLVETLSVPGAVLALCASLLLWTALPLGLALGRFRIRRPKPSPAGATRRQESSVDDWTARLLAAEWREALIHTETGGDET